VESAGKTVRMFTRNGNYIRRLQPEVGSSVAEPEPSRDAFPTASALTLVFIMDRIFLMVPYKRNIFAHFLFVFTLFLIALNQKTKQLEPSY
jgi:hypothetical protein